jgi:arylsulfatase A-like enzyme
MRILVIEASALHLGFVGCYGNDWVATPNLDRLAAEGVVFDQHLADSPEPFAAEAWWQRSAVTGMYQVPGSSARLAVAEGAIRYETIPRLNDFAARIIGVLHNRDHAAAAIVWIDGPSLAPPWRLPDDLLTVYAEEEELDVQALADPKVGLAEPGSDELDRVQTAYAAVVTFFDAQIGRLMDHLREDGVLDRLLLCITASCGLPLGEHGMIGTHRAWMHDELVHVPLIMRLPAADRAGLRIAALTQPVDLAPTFAELLGTPLSDAQGRSLAPLMRGEADDVRPYAACGLRLGDSEEWLLRTPERALLVPIQVPAGDPPRQAQLYVKPDDRWEVNDLAQRHGEEAEQLHQTLRAFVEATRHPGPLLFPPLPEELPILEETS